MRSLMLAAVALLTGCLPGSFSTSKYYLVETLPAWQQEWDLTSVMAERVAKRQPDEIEIVSPRERHLKFYSGKVLRKGQEGFTSPVEKERLVVVLVDGAVTSMHRTVQVIEWTTSGCDYGHGGGCGSESGISCEYWGRVDQTRECATEINRARNRTR